MLHAGKESPQHCHRTLLKPIINAADLEPSLRATRSLYQGITSFFQIRVSIRSGWRGFHHHATKCIATYGFLVSERETLLRTLLRQAVRRTCRSRR